MEQGDMAFNVAGPLMWNMLSAVLYLVDKYTVSQKNMLSHFIAVSNSERIFKIG